MGESLIPRFIALGREKKYLRYVVEKGELHSRMQLISDKVVSDHEKLFTKLELVRAESITSSENEALVHIRSCYNNKFLVLSKDVENWVVAEADEPKEDRSKWSCTLFRLGRGQQSVRLFLQAAGAEHGVVVDATEKCLTIGRNSGSATDFSIIDLASTTMLHNNQYLAANNFLHNRQLNHETALIPPNTNIGNGLSSLTYNKSWKKVGNHNFIWSQENNSTANINNASTLQNIAINNPNHARISEVKTVFNWSQTNTIKKQLEFTYTKMSESEAYTSMWSQAKFSVLVQGNIGINIASQGTVKWLETIETDEEIKSFVKVCLPPMTKVEVTLFIGNGEASIDADECDDASFTYTKCHSEKTVTIKQRKVCLSKL